MDGLQQGDLAIDVEESSAPPLLLLRWRGKSAARVPGAALGPFFTRVLDRAGAAGAAVEMRFHALDHFNSSTMTSVIDLVQDAARRRVRVVIAYDRAVKWQRISFEALGVFDKGDGLLEIQGS